MKTKMALPQHPSARIGPLKRNKRRRNQEDDPESESDIDMLANRTLRTSLHPDGEQQYTPILLVPGLLIQSKQNTSPSSTDMLPRKSLRCDPTRKRRHPRSRRGAMSFLAYAFTLVAVMLLKFYGGTTCLAQGRSSEMPLGRSTAARGRRMNKKRTVNNTTDTDAALIESEGAAGPTNSSLAVPSFAPTPMEVNLDQFSSNKVLETTFVGGQEGYGAMFDISTIASATVITGIDVVVKSTLSNEDILAEFEMYTLSGSYVGQEDSPSNWKRVNVTLADVSTTPVLADSGDQLVQLTFDEPLWMGAETTRGWYMTLSQQKAMVYTEAPPDKPTGSLFRSSNFIEVTVGVGVTYQFGVLRQNIGFNGVIRYAIATSAPTLAPVISPDSTVLKTKQSIFIVGVGDVLSNNGRQRRERGLLRRLEEAGSGSAFDDGAVKEYFEFVVGEFVSKHLKEESSNSSNETPPIEIKRVSVNKSYVTLAGDGDNMLGRIPAFEEVSRVGRAKDNALTSSDTPVLYVETTIEAEYYPPPEVDKFPSLVETMFLLHGTQFVDDLKTTYFYGELFNNALWASSKTVPLEDNGTAVDGDGDTLAALEAPPSDPEPSNGIGPGVISAVVLVSLVAVIAVLFIVRRMNTTKKRNPYSSELRRTEFNRDDGAPLAMVEPRRSSHEVYADLSSKKRGLGDKKKSDKSRGPSHAAVVGAGSSDIGTINRILGVQQAGRDDMTDLSPLFGSDATTTVSRDNSSPRNIMVRTKEESKQPEEILLQNSGGSSGGGDLHKLQSGHRPFGHKNHATMDDSYGELALDDAGLKDYLLKMEQKEASGRKMQQVDGSSSKKLSLRRGSSKSNKGASSKADGSNGKPVPQGTERNYNVDMKSEFLETFRIDDSDGSVDSTSKSSFGSNQGVSQSSSPPSPKQVKGRRVITDLKDVISYTDSAEVTPSSDEAGGSTVSEQSPEDRSVASTQSVVSATPDDFKDEEQERIRKEREAAGDESKGNSGSASGVSSETSSLPSRYKEMWASVSDPDALNLLKARLSDRSLDVDNLVEEHASTEMFQSRNNLHDEKSSLSSSSTWSAVRMEREEAERQASKSVQFHPSVVTDVMYRPKTSAEDVERLYYQGHKKLKRKPRKPPS
jgi:hypothetical protein